jgi:threonine dehydrogenase-like Zn-dependent dehydrogenase
VDVREALVEMTGGIGPDACIDAVGMESHGFTIDNTLDQVKAAVGLATDRPHALRQVIVACRKGGRVSIPGVYGGMADKFPIGALMEKGLSVKSGQTHVQKYMPELLELILEGKLDTTFLISHRLPLEEAAHGYKIFKEQQNDVTKVVLKPHEATRHQAVGGLRCICTVSAGRANQRFRETVPERAEVL